MEGQESGQRKVDEYEYTQDGTVDLKGNPVLRSKRGGWTACSFVVRMFSFSSLNSLMLQRIIESNCLKLLVGQCSKISGPVPLFHTTWRGISNRGVPLAVMV